MKLNLGCGSQVLDGWINVDFAMGARFAKLPFFRRLNRKLRLFDLDWDQRIYLHDLTKRFPWPDDSVDTIYSSHTLEHFSKEGGRRFLAECHRVLRKNGVIRIVVPDLRHILAEYDAGRIQADDLVGELGVLYQESKNRAVKLLSPYIQFPHKCVYDSPRLLSILSELGFEVSNRDVFDSDICDIRLIELEERTAGAVIVEGRKR